MDRIIIWGTGHTYELLRDYIRELENEGKIQIVKFVSKSDVPEMDGHPVIASSELAHEDYDRILICAETEQAFDISTEIKNLGISEDKVDYAIEYLKKNSSLGRDYSETVHKQCEVLSRILHSTDEEISSYDWMYDRICEYGIYPFKELEDPRIFKTLFGILQTVEEFTEYCNYLSTLSVRSALEIGVFKGRSSYLMCAILARKNPELEYKCVDIFDNMDSFEEYRKVLPMLKKCIPNTSSDFKNEKYDFVFIDGDHSYDGSIDDYNNVGQFASVITVFHDIYGHEYDKKNGGVVRTWEEVLERTKQCNHHVFSKYPEKWMGIGVVEWNG